MAKVTDKDSGRTIIGNARYWVGILYNENMRSNWEQEIGDIVQVPYAYTIHDGDKDLKDEARKVHTHMILAFPNTTTYNHALNVFSLLSAPGARAINKCEAIINIRNKYDYLIHDTEAAQKAGKHLYDTSERIEGNGFDIGLFEQISAQDKILMCKELCDFIIDNGFSNFADFYISAMKTFDVSTYFEILKTNASMLEKLTKANWQKSQFPTENTLPDTHRHTSDTHENTPKACPECGSVDLKKNGVTVGNKPRYRCKDCGKSWSE